jgi:hypothetical protein
VDESATGSVNSFLRKSGIAERRFRSRHSKPLLGRPDRRLTRGLVPVCGPAERRAPAVTIAAVHLRMPSIDQGVQAFVWAFVLFLIMWLGAILLGYPAGTSFLISILIACAIFLLVRTRGGDHPGAE